MLFSVLVVYVLDFLHIYSKSLLFDAIFGEEYVN